MDKNPITITIDLEKIRDHVSDVAGDGLEASNGMTPDNLDEAFHSMRRFLPPEAKDLVSLMTEVIQILKDAHNSSQE